MLQDHAAFENIRARQAERELALKAVSELMAEYLKNIPVSEWDMAETDRLYREARARVLYGV